jgi:hypothetical protein
VRADILAADNSAQGFNVGMNCGEVAGQTVSHCQSISFCVAVGTSPNLAAA